jgi:transposase
MFWLDIMVRRSTADRWAVVSWHKEGLTVGGICRKTGFDHRFVTRWVEKFERGDPIEDEKRSGRPKKLSKTKEIEVERKLTRKRRHSSRVVARDLKRFKVADISYKTVQRTAKNRGLRSYRRGKTSKLTEKHKQDRLKFAKANKTKDWSAVMFSDEHRFKQFKGGNPAHDRVWARSAEDVPSKEVERWGMAMDVWGAISSLGKTELYFYEGSLDANTYQEILQQALIPAATKYFKDEQNGWEFQHDKASSHTSQSTKRFLEENDIAMVEGWPTKGDDINPIENLWAILDERLEEKRFTTRAAMKKSILEIWKTVDNHLLGNLIESVPNRLRRIVKAKGGSIKRIH